MIYVIACVIVASQSSTNDALGYDKKVPIISVSNSTPADEDHTKSFKDTSQTPLGGQKYVV